jgi:hypothetical protein
MLVHDRPLVQLDDGFRGRLAKIQCFMVIAPSNYIGDRLVANAFILLLQTGCFEQKIHLGVLRAGWAAVVDTSM